MFAIDRARSRPGVHMIYNIIGITLIVIGSVALLASLQPVRRIIRQLPGGILRRGWIVLSLMILLFLVGYTAVGYSIWGSLDQAAELIVPMIFFSGGFFVLLVSQLSLRTALDLQRITSLEVENITDALTGLYNRRYLDRRLEEEVQRAQRYQHPLSVLIIDIDRFKTVNDVHGHTIGDQALRCLASTLQQSVRRIDIVTRYGGEEFMVIAQQTDLENAAYLAERLRRVVEYTQLACCENGGDDDPLSVTISVGVATWEMGEAINTFIKRADKALLRAKHDGRNQVRIANPMVETVCS